ncbi:hypothetical protein ACHAWF_007143, partial [Thalassiosira exigua]
HGNRVIKYFCLNVCKTGHAGKDCANAIKKSIEKLEHAGLDTSVYEFCAITGDASGGGAVQNVYPLLQGNSVLSNVAKMLNFQYHALNTCFEIACQHTFGKQGIHNVNIFQAIYIYVHLITSLKERAVTS